MSNPEETTLESKECDRNIQEVMEQITYIANMAIMLKPLNKDRLQTFVTLKMIENLANDCLVLLSVYQPKSSD